jgi:superfamily II DNA/RNA helicase
VGRTARQGRKGAAIILLSDRDFHKMDKIKEVQKGRIVKAEAGEYEKVKKQERRRFTQRRRMPQRRRMGGPRRKYHR